MPNIFTRKFIAGSLSLFLFLFLLIPVLSLAQDANDPGPLQEQNSGLIRCGNNPRVVMINGSSTIVGDCDFDDFVATLNRIINWIISIAGVIFTISFIYGGFLWMTSGGDSGKTGKAREILWSTLKGFVIILVAWLIVYTLLKALVPDNSEYRNSIFKFIGNGN